MDIRDLKKNSDLSYDVAVAKRNALEKARSRQVLVHHGHLFRADPETINLVKALIDQSVDNVVLLDTNDVLQEGQEVWVKLLGFDDRGKVRLAMKMVDQETGEERSEEEASAE